MNAFPLPKPGDARTDAQSWTVSALLHGLAVGLTIMLVSDFTPAPQPEPFHWEASMVTAPPTDSVDTPTPAPSQPMPPTPAPAKAQPAPRPAQTVPLMEATRDAPSQTVPEATTEQSPVFEPQPETVSQKDALPPAPVMPSELPARATPPVTQVDYSWLAEALWSRIEQLKRYPHMARSNRLEGTVVLRAVIKADGSLHDLTVVNSSGHLLIDQDAQETLRKACPLKLKRAMEQPQVVMHVPINYRLDQP